MKLRRGKIAKDTIGIAAKPARPVEARAYALWRGAAAGADGFAGRLADGFMLGIKRILCGRINAACGIESRLTAYDEEIFMTYRRVIDAYKAAVAVDMGEAAPERAGVYEIWNGIHSVLGSRLVGAADAPGNPVLAEKKEIAAEIIKNAMAICDNMMDDFVARRRSGFAADLCRGFLAGDICEIVDNFAKAAIDELIGGLHGVYADAAHVAQIKLNNLSARPQAQQYYDLLLTEQQILAMLIKIQVSEIEKRLKSNEDLPLTAAINILREAHQRVGGDIAEIWGFFAEEGERIKQNLGRADFQIDTPQELISDFVNIPAKDWVINSDLAQKEFSTRYDLFLDCLDEYAGGIIGDKLRRLAKERIYYLRKAASEQDILVKEAIACFSNILQYYKDSAEALAASDFGDITAGIGETIEIKLDGMNESLEYFKQESNGMIENYRNQNPLPDENQLNDMGRKAAEGAAYALCGAGKNPLRGWAAISDALENWHEAESLRDAHLAREREWNRAREQVEKICIRHLKDNLLFELTTFEEIAHYSVSRLREGENEAVAGFVSIIDAQIGGLELILAKYGIDLIRPIAHEPFNAKEHEVLMAETSPEYKKGEIIKVMNSGYKRGEAVILRANVIAAR
ncbi:MAG: nucleotide exchange factor GrpE [Defluviitaleaceae bacterium]|nr:nucleotide exchange factor GrpE [Defluviitaleaceae bacterium]